MTLQSRGMMHLARAKNMKDERHNEVRLALAEAPLERKGDLQLITKIVMEHSDPHQGNHADGRNPKI